MKSSSTVSFLASAMRAKRPERKPRRAMEERRTIRTSISHEDEEEGRDYRERQLLQKTELKG
jgi:hypothetical protein